MLGFTRVPFISSFCILFNLRFVSTVFGKFPFNPTYTLAFNLIPFLKIDVALPVFMSRRTMPKN